MTTAIMDELCRELRNYFVVDEIDGDFSVVGGELSPAIGVLPGQYYCISGSIFNDGIHCHPDVDLVDETFTGTIWRMAVPRGFMAMAEDVEKYRRRMSELGAVGGGYVSESFGDYSYSVSSSVPQDVAELQERIKVAKRQFRRCL